MAERIDPLAPQVASPRSTMGGAGSDAVVLRHPNRILDNISIFLPIIVNLSLPLLFPEADVLLTYVHY